MKGKVTNEDILTAMNDIDESLLSEAIAFRTRKPAKRVLNARNRAFITSVLAVAALAGIVVIAGRTLSGTKQGATDSYAPHSEMAAESAAETEAPAEYDEMMAEAEADYAAEEDYAAAAGGVVTEGATPSLTVLGAGGFTAAAEPAETIEGSMAEEPIAEAAESYKAAEEEVSVSDEYAPAVSGTEPTVLRLAAADGIRVSDDPAEAAFTLSAEPEGYEVEVLEWVKAEGSEDWTSVPEYENADFTEIPELADSDPGRTFLLKSGHRYEFILTWPDGFGGPGGVHYILEIE